MTNRSIAIASVKSFGDFVIVHSVLHRIGCRASGRVRVLACNHLKALNMILPDDVPVTLVDSGEDVVPALFDVRKRGALAAVQSAIFLRREFQNIERDSDEVLAFDAIGVRERFIAGRWPVVSPSIRASNIYETYQHFFTTQDLESVIARSPADSAALRTIGIFPESRLVKKRLTGATLSLIMSRVARAGLDAKLFILEGDLSLQPEYSCRVDISRDFESLSDAIRSVDAVISADSLPAHLAEYFARPVFVASPTPNEYWLPHRCFLTGRWGIFGDEQHFSSRLDTFLAEPQSG